MADGNKSTSRTHAWRKAKEAQQQSLARILERSKLQNSQSEESVLPVDEVKSAENVLVDNVYSDNIRNVSESPCESDVQSEIDDRSDKECLDYLDDDSGYRYSSIESFTSENEDTFSDDSDEDYFSDSEQFIENNFILDVKKWGIEYKIKLNALSALLKILDKNVDNVKFPHSSRTLLGTPRSTKIQPIAGGEYYHFGLKNIIISIIKERISIKNNNTIIDLLINTDGAPTGKSSEKNLWPILCCEIDSTIVYPIGIFHGDGKPKDVDQFLTPFVNEAIDLLANGVEHASVRYQVKIKGLICDAPAKAMVLNVVYPTGYNSCSKCEIEGSYIGQIYFPSEKDVPLRTDEKFKEQYYDDYQKGETILNSLPIGLVTNVPLNYMHLLCLGITRKLLLFWTQTVPFKLSTTDKTKISDALISFRPYIPSEFARLPRSLKSVKQWKATEYRQFLLYTGLIVLKNILRKDMYNNFLALHIAITILASPYYSHIESYLQYAEELLKYFVETFQMIYGSKLISHNVHNLLHLVDDVRRFGHLDRFSAFPFETCIFKLKNMIRKYDKPLQQIARRFTESENVAFQNSCSKKSNTNVQIFEKLHKQGPLIHENFDGQYKKLYYNNFCIDVNKIKDNNVLVDGTFVKVQNFVKINKSMHLIGKQLKPIDLIYSDPCDSSILMSNIVELDSTLKTWPCSKIEAKLIALLNNDKLYVFPLVHTYKK